MNALKRLLAHSRSLAKDERGAPAVEFALVLPLAVMTIAGLFEFSMLYLEWDTAHHSAGQIARYAFINVNADGADANIANIENQIKEYAASNTPWLTVNPVYTKAKDGAGVTECTPGARVIKLNISFTHTFQTPFIGGLAGDDFVVNFTADAPIYCKPTIS